MKKLKKKELQAVFSGKGGETAARVIVRQAYSSTFQTFAVLKMKKEQCIDAIYRDQQGFMDADLSACELDKQEPGMQEWVAKAQEYMRGNIPNLPPMVTMVQGVVLEEKNIASEEPDEDESGEENAVLNPPRTFPNPEEAVPETLFKKPNTDVKKGRITLDETKEVTAVKKEATQRDTLDVTLTIPKSALQVGGETPANDHALEQVLTALNFVQSNLVDLNARVAEVCDCLGALRGDVGCLGDALEPTITHQKDLENILLLLANVTALQTPVKTFDDLCTFVKAMDWSK